MANSEKLQVTELDFDGIKENLKTFLKAQTQFKDYDFEGSGMSILLDTLAYILLIWYSKNISPQRLITKIMSL